MEEVQSCLCFNPGFGLNTEYLAAAYVLWGLRMGFRILKSITLDPFLPRTGWPSYTVTRSVHETKSV